jgi:hypothetical protein
LVAVLGPAAAALKTVGIVRRYDDNGYWQVPIDEPAVIKHILATSGLHAEEQVPLADLKTTGAVRKALEKIGDTATPRHTALLEKMKGNFKRDNAATAATDIL